MTTYTLKGLRRPIAEKRPLISTANNASGFRTEVVGYETFDVELVFDLDSIAKELGRAAGSNKSGRAVAMSGLIKAYARNRKRVS